MEDCSQSSGKLNQNDHKKYACAKASSGIFAQGFVATGQRPVAAQGRHSEGKNYFQQAHGAWQP